MTLNGVVYGEMVAVGLIIHLWRATLNVIHWNKWTAELSCWTLMIRVIFGKHQQIIKRQENTKKTWKEVDSLRDERYWKPWSEKVVWRWLGYVKNCNVYPHVYLNINKAIVGSIYTSSALCTSIPLSRPIMHFQWGRKPFPAIGYAAYRKHVRGGPSHGHKQHV